MTSRKILIDTDPGIDDALAVLYAFACPDLDVVAMTSIFGNCSTMQSTANIGVLQRFASAPVLVGAGAQRPLFGAAHPPATFVHGDDGLGDCGHGVAPASPGPLTAAQLIIDTVAADPGAVSIVALGPLTNLALALAIEPRIAEWTHEVVIMGGAFGVAGNASPVAEANIIHDAYAAEQVFAADWNTAVVPLDVTTQVLMGRTYLDDLGQRGGEAGQFLREVTRFYEDFHRAKDIVGIQAHDPTAMMYLTAPHAFLLDEGPMTVAIGGPTHGQTVADRRGADARPVEWSDRPPTRYGVSADADLLLEVFRSPFVG